LSGRSRLRRGQLNYDFWCRHHSLGTTARQRGSQFEQLGRLAEHLVDAWRHITIGDETAPQPVSISTSVAGTLASPSRPLATIHVRMPRSVMTTG